MKALLGSALLFIPLSLFAAPPSAEFAPEEIPAAPVLALPAIDIDKALAEDQVQTKDKPRPIRYALGHAIRDIQPGGAKTAMRGGRWSTLSDGRLLWQLEVHAPGAVSLDFGFSEFRLPHGAELWMVDALSDASQGPFTDADNPLSGEFWTPLMRSDKVRLELVLPADKRQFLHLKLDTVHHGYKDLLGGAVGAKSGSCNVDVVCSAGNGWRDQIRSVAVVAYNNSGNRSGNACSGQFVNSTGATSGPLFLSANHCEIEGASARVYFNFQNSTCRTPGSAASGQNGDGALNVSLFGATMLAQTDPAGGIVSSDFALLRFHNPAPAAAALFLSGWDRRDLAPSNGTGIHHPSGDEKRISVENNPLSITAYAGNLGSGNTHLRIADWDTGTTEPGSSGSGLWNSDRRLVGVLSGGLAACGNDDPDWYGRLAHAWEGLGSSNRRLRDWLDNAGTQAQTLDGKNYCSLTNVTISSAAFTSNPVAASNVTFQASASGASGALTYAWDIDGDGVTDRSGTQSSITLSYPTPGSYQIRLSVTDPTGCNGGTSRALDVVGPKLTATAATPQQICGDNDNAIEPGERWRLPVTLHNNSSVGLAAGARALFVPGAASSQLLPIGPNQFGYGGIASADGACDYAFVDIASGAGSVAALPTTAINNDFGPNDDARTTNAIALGGNGISLYGQTYTQAVMSTNGYVSFSVNEGGGDYDNSCDGVLDRGASGPQLRVQHDDLLVSGLANAGLRYKYFASCPRSAESKPVQAQACHVFQWSRMQRYNQDNNPTGDFEFQAIAYEQTGQITYQYRTAAPDAGASSTIGLVDATGRDPLNARCNQANAASAQSAICLFTPNAPPAKTSGLRMESPAIALGALTAGAQTTLQVPFAIAPDASCGAPLAIDYVATTGAGSFSTNATTLLRTTLGAGGTCQTHNACPAQIPAIDVRHGMYLNPTRSGNGLANFVYGNAYASVWYTAMTDRTPTWYILAGAYSDNLGTVPITYVRNTVASPGVVTTTESVGRAWIAQIDSDELIHAWRFDDGSTGAEWMQTVALPFSNPNHTQTWYAPAQAGWGLGIESLQTGPSSVFEFIAAYIHDASGTPRWLTGSSDSLSGGNVPLSAYLVHCPGCPWITDWDSFPRAAGALSRTYTGPTQATLNAAITLPAPLSGSWNRTAIPITTIQPPQPAAKAKP